MISKDKFDYKVIWKMYFQIELHVEVGGAIAEMSVGSIAFKKVKGRRQNPIIVCFKEISCHIFQSSQLAGWIFAFSFIIIIIIIW